MNENEQQLVTEDVDAILPEGWNGKDDFFNTDTWGGGDANAEPDFFAEGDDQINTLGDNNEVPADGAEAPTTEPETPAANDQQTAESTGEEAPTTETETPATEEAPANNGKYKFKARYDHQDQDVEVDLATELPTLWQKAQATDRAQTRLAEQAPTMERLEHLAKVKGYANVTEMLDATEKYDREDKMEELKNQGVPEEIAAFYVDQKFGQPRQQPAAEEQPAVQETEQRRSFPARNYQAELEELWEARPDMKGKSTFAPEVVQAALSGKNLLLALTEYERDQARAASQTAKADAEKTATDNKILRQNAEAASRAPVTGVTSGSATRAQAPDPFLAGLTGDYW